MMAWAALHLACLAAFLELADGAPLLDAPLERSPLPSEARQRLSPGNAIASQAYPVAIKQADEVPDANLEDDHFAGDIAQPQRIALKWPLVVRIAKHAFGVDHNDQGV
jgi:hypothetical protein